MGYFLTQLNKTKKKKKTYWLTFYRVLPYAINPPREVGLCRENQAVCFSPDPQT